MNKFIIIPIIVSIVVILPALYFTGIVPVKVTSDGLSPVFDEAELMERSILAIHGSIVDVDTEVVFENNGDIISPYVFSIWTIASIDTIKGTEQEKIQFKTSGGTYRNIVHHSHSPSFEIGDEVIVFLSKDPDSVWGNSYYLTGIASGVFEIDANDNATNKLRDVTVNVEQLKNTLRSFEP